MPVEVSWGNPEKTVIYSTYSEMWTLEEHHAAIDQIHSMVMSVGHTVDFIGDFSKSRSSPAKLVSSGRHMENVKTSNTGINVIVNASPFIKAMAQVVLRMFLKDVTTYFANSREEAYQMIERHREKTSNQGLRT
jgi:hypothetical protein